MLPEKALNSKSFEARNADPFMPVEKWHGTHKRNLHYRNFLDTARIEMARVTKKKGSARR